MTSPTRPLHPKWNYLAPTEWFALVTTLAIIALFLVSGYQGCELRKESIATKQSADVSVATVRAWVAVVDWIVPEPRSLGRGGLGMMIENVGKTPALNLTISQEGKLWRVGQSLPVLKSCAELPIPTAIGNVLQAGGRPVRVSEPLVLTDIDAGQLSKLGDQTIGLVLHGCITYENVLNAAGRALPGQTEYCTIFYTQQNKNLTIGCGSH